jgi:hypothetical protein
MNLAGFLRNGGQMSQQSWNYPDPHDQNTIHPDALMQDQLMRREYPMEQDEMSGERYALVPPAAFQQPPAIPPWNTQVFPELPPWQTMVTRNPRQGL